MQDAIEAAGGVTEYADLNRVNLAYVVQDGQKISIPNVNTVETEDYIIENIGEEIIVEDRKASISLVNINKANQAELESLTGIGPSTALKIINYRKEIGKFNSIEDIKNVPGIGEAKFDAIKNEICV